MFVASFIGSPQMNFIDGEVKIEGDKAYALFENEKILLPEEATSKLKGHNILDGKKTEFIAAEPESCPKLTRGKFEYDFGDEAGYTPLLPMYTLGHDFKPANIHAGGLRYHGAGTIVSQLIKDKMMHGVDIPQLESFEAGLLFARTEGIIPAPESCHAIEIGRAHV